MKCELISKATYMYVKMYAPVSPGIAWNTLEPKNLYAHSSLK